MIFYCLSMILSTFLCFLMFPLIASSILSILLIFCYSNTAPLRPISPVLDKDSDPHTSTYCFYTENNFSFPLESWRHFLKSFPVIFPSTMKTEHINGERFRRKVFTKSPMRSGRMNELKDKRHYGEFSVRRMNVLTPCAWIVLCSLYSLVEHIKLKLSMKWHSGDQSAMVALFSFKN